MSLVRTPLLQAPAGERDMFGRTMLSKDIVAKLQMLNPRISLWEQFPPEIWWPGKDWKDTDWGVKTSLWLGLPGEDGSQKISAIHLGAVPEYTQIGPEGKTMVKGWRAILEKVIKVGAATRTQIEVAFGITLDYVNEDTLLCGPCLKAGRRRRHTGGLLRLCRLHEQVKQAAMDLIAHSSGDPEVRAAANEALERRLNDVHVQVRGESQSGWTPPGK